MKFSIIIVNYNLAKEIDESLFSIKSNVNLNETEIILIDNNSSENLIYDIAEKYNKSFGEKFSFIKLKKNVGFGQACNIAAKHAIGKVLFFLNPDTKLEQNITDKLLKHQGINRLLNGEAIVGLNVNNSNILDFSAGYFPNIFFELLNIVSLGRYTEAFLISLFTKINENVLNVDWVMGAALLVSKKLFMEINGFNKDYFLYFEEMDMCFRVKEKNKSIIYFPDLNIFHIGSSGSKRNYYFFTKMFYKGKLLFLKRSKKNFSSYSKLLYLHIWGQMIYWKIFNNNISKSADKINAFKEILSNINCPENISNKQVLI